MSEQCLSSGFAQSNPGWFKALFVLAGFEAAALLPFSLSTICTTPSILPLFQELVGLFPHPELLLPWETLSCTLHLLGELLPQSPAPLFPILPLLFTVVDEVW